MKRQHAMIVVVDEQDPEGSASRLNNEIKLGWTVEHVAPIGAYALVILAKDEAEPHTPAPFARNMPG